MNKKDVQKRVLQNGKPLALSKFNWNEKARTFSTKENGLVIDFKGISNCTFKTGSGCTFRTGYGCTFKTGYRCTFDTGSGCTFKTGYDCTFDTGYGCTFDTGSNCTFKTGFSCTFKTGYRCTFDTGYGCTFKTGYDCTFKTGSNCTFKTGFSCVIVRRDIFEVITLTEKENKIQLCPFNIKGFIKDGKYSVTGMPSIIADGILSEVISTKEKGGLVIRKVINRGETKKSFLVERDGVFSHGSTVKQAVDSLKYKISDRDTSKYSDYTLDTELKQVEAIQMYLAITGACETGTRYFVESLDNPPEQLTVKELIKLTEHQYGNETLKQFFNI